MMFVAINASTGKVEAFGKSSYMSGEEDLIGHEDPELLAKEETWGDGIRHCAFCFVAMPTEKAKLCGKCRKRAYCSRDCQMEDWVGGDGGQVHRKWCRLDCGEEDLDWMIRPIEGKGVGVFAKRMFPARSRIMVEHSRSFNHPGLKYLTPLNGTRETKFQQHLMLVDTDDMNAPPMNVLCLRIARVNHACDANACSINDHKDPGTKILFADRDIQEGEEILTATANFRSFTKDECGRNFRDCLKAKWGIVCPPDCICRDEKMLKLVAECEEIKPKVYGQNLNLAVKSFKLLLEKEEQMRCNLIRKTQLMYLGFELGIIRKVTFELAQECIDEAYAIYSSILHPKSRKLKEYKKYKNDFSTHIGYLCHGTEYQSL